jgi:hypothetical protein
MYCIVDNGQGWPEHSKIPGSKRKVSPSFSAKLFFLNDKCSTQLDKIFDKRSQKCHRVSVEKTRKFFGNLGSVGPPLTMVLIDYCS